MSRAAEAADLARSLAELRAQMEAEHDRLDWMELSPGRRRDATPGAPGDSSSWRPAARTGRS
ncbi:MAG: hypothetical protein ACKVWR_22835 [Acidimicrobiales bacterium]